MKILGRLLYLFVIIPLFVGVGFASFFLSLSFDGIWSQLACAFVLGFNLFFGYILYRLGKRLFPPGPAKQKRNISPQELSEQTSLEREKLPEAYLSLERPRVSPSFRADRISLNPLISALIVFGVFLLGALPKIEQLLVEYRLSQGGVLTRADITDAWEESGESIEYYISYQFRTSVNGDTTIFKNKQSVSAGYFWKINHADTVEILYDPDDPQTSRIREQMFHLALLDYLAFGIVTLFGLGLIGGFLEYRTRKARHSRLQEVGQPASALVFDRWKTEDRDSEGGVSDNYYVAYAYPAATINGQPKLWTRAEQVDKNLFERMQIGTSWPVRYLPEDPFVCEIFVETGSLTQASLPPRSHAKGATG